MLPPLPATSSAPATQNMVMHGRRKDYINYEFAALFYNYHAVLPQHDFKKLTISQSSIRWWTALPSEAEEVVMEKPSYGICPSHGI